MKSLIKCEWAAIMTTLLMVAVFCLCPTKALSHLGSALRAGADGRPPVLSHVRVSREPQYSRPGADSESSDESFIPTSRMKSPSYQHRVLQFHSTGQTGQDYLHLPRKLIVSEYPSVKTLPPYPVPSKYGKLGTTRYVLKSPSSDKPYNPNFGYNSDEDGDERENYSIQREGAWEPKLLPEPEDPTFTPYIGARALTNMNKFFEHLRENLEAIYEKKGKEGESQQHQQQEKLSSALNDEVAVGNEEDVDKSSESQDDIEKIATPTRRGYSSKPDDDVNIDHDSGEPKPAESVYRHNSGSTTSNLMGKEGDNRRRGDMTNRDSRSSASSFILANRFTNQKANPDAPDEKTRELLHFLGHGAPRFSKANKYNPGWLFTNLGLGKRSEMGQLIL